MSMPGMAIYCTASSTPALQQRSDAAVAAGLADTRAAAVALVGCDERPHSRCCYSLLVGAANGPPSDSTHVGF